MIRAAIEAVQTATDVAAPRLTVLLRSNALQAGWSPEAVSSLTVSGPADEFVVEGSDAALAEEYGDVESRPKPAVRQFMNRRSAIDEQIVGAVEARIGGLL